MTETAPDLKRFGEIVRLRREELGLRQDQLPEGPSTTALTGIENGRSMPAAVTLRKLDSSLRWEPGSAKRTLEGGQPTPLSEARATSTESETDESRWSYAPADPVEGMRHVSGHMWSVAEKFTDALVEEDPSPRLRKASHQLVRMYGLQLAEHLMRFKASSEDRDAALADLYRRRDAAEQKIGAEHVVEAEQTEGTSDEKRPAKEAESDGSKTPVGDLAGNKRRTTHDRAEQGQ